jgi:hypothetical protein
MRSEDTSPAGPVAGKHLSRSANWVSQLSEPLDFYSGHEILRAI